MRLKSINKTSGNSVKNEANKNNHGLSFNVLNQDINNVDENSFDLDMDSGEVF